MPSRAPSPSDFGAIGNGPGTIRGFRAVASTANLERLGRHQDAAPEKPVVDQGRPESTRDKGKSPTKNINVAWLDVAELTRAEWLDDEDMELAMYMSLNPPHPESPKSTRTITPEAVNMRRPHIGRPRRASMLLNQNWNATRLSSASQPKPIKCPIHDGECDGQTTTNLHLSLQTQLGRGFADLYPTIQARGRTMVHWDAIMREERSAIASRSGLIGGTLG